jgi:hypothetical protein
MVTLHRKTVALALAAVVVAAETASRADSETVAPAPRWRLGVGAGGSWLPNDGGTSTLLVEAVAGVDLGPYSVRLSPRFQYFAVAEYPSWTLSVGSVAIEGALRLTPWYELSVAPFVGYSYASTPPPCFGVCYGEAFSTGPSLGVSVSPATIVFGPRAAFEAGAYVTLFEYPNTGMVYLSSYLGVRWFFFGSGG